MISVIVTAYNEEDSVLLLYEQIVNGLNKCNYSEYEIWFVNDGSKDGTEEQILNIMAKDPDVHIISFRKNFGKSKALNAAFRHVKGEYIFTMDADLQDDADEFPRFIDKIEEGWDVVVGWKKERHDSLEKKIPSKIFNFVTSSFSGLKLHDFDCGFKCFRLDVVKALHIYGELHRYIPVLAYREGFSITEIVVKHHKREHGKSKYGAERYMRGGLDFLTTTFLLKYYDRPMYFFGRLGLASGAVGFCICLYLTILWFNHYSIGGRPLLVLGVMLIVLGLQFFATGFLGNLIVDVVLKNNYSENHIKMIK